MSTIRKCIFCLFILIHINVFGQNKIDNNSLGLGIDLGYSYRKKNELTGGINLLYNGKTDYKKASFIGATLDGQFLFGVKKNYGGARLNLEYLYWVKNGMGFQCNLSGETNKLVGFGLDGRIGFNFAGFYNFFYGYNLYRKTSVTELSKHSVGITIQFNKAIFDLALPDY